MNCNIINQPMELPNPSEHHTIFFGYGQSNLLKYLPVSNLFQNECLEQEEELYPSFMLRESDPPDYLSNKKQPQQESFPGAQDETFKPGYRFLHLVKTRPFHCLLLVFDTTTFKDLQHCWKEWAHCAISVPYSAFSENADRRYLLQFSEHFKLLMEALYVAAAQNLKGKSKQPFLSDFDTPNAGLPDQRPAYKKIVDFATRYPENRPRDYIWSVFECAVADGDDFNIERKNLLFEYECFLCMAKAPRYLLKHHPALFETGADGEQ